VPLMARVTGFQDALDPNKSAGVGGATGGTRVSKVSGRVVPSGDAASYTWWHNDMAQPDDFACPAYRHVKLFVWIFDVPRGGGATTVVPGTHRLPGRPQTTLARVGLDDYPVCKREQERSPDVLPQELMPNCFEAALPAGAAIAFDSSIWHTTFANHSGHDRRGAHFTYRSSGAASQGGRPGLSEATLWRLEAEGKLGVLRRRILGLQDTGFEWMSVLL
jgi:ectoine hydroxylase-related dioxygenase (phytanoyl-CoA dioxygenase family)